MIITEIIPVTKQRYRVVTDEQLAFVLYKGELSRYRLQKDMELPHELLERILEEVLIKRAKLRAMHLLNRMDYTESQLRKKLEQGEYTSRAVDIALEYVKSYHYLDDARYVQRYLACCEGKKSRKQAEFDLERKGVSRQLIAECRQKMEEELEESDETELIRSILEKRCKDPKSADEKEIRRHYGYFVRKGFSSSDIWSGFHDFFERFS